MDSIYYEELDPALTYSYTGWETVDSPDFHGTSARRTSSPSAWVQLTFQGSAISFIGSQGEDHGDLEITLDGRKSIVDGRGLTQHQVVQFKADGLGTEVHSIQVLNLRNTRGTARTVLDIDGFIVTPHSFTSNVPPGMLHAWYFVVVILTVTALHLNYLWNRRSRSSKQVESAEAFAQIVPLALPAVEPPKCNSTKIS